MEVVTRFLTKKCFSWISSFLGPDCRRRKIRPFSKTRRDIRDFRCLAGVNDTGEAYYSGVIDTDENNHTGINDPAV